MDRETLIREGKHSEFWKIISEAMDKRIESARNQLEFQTNIDRLKFLQYDIKVCRQFKNLPDILLKPAETQGEKKAS